MSDDIGWHQIRIDYPGMPPMPRWLFAFNDGERWYVPGIAWDAEVKPGACITHVGPKLPIPMDIERKP